MRVYGRVYDNFENYTWQEVTTDVNGFNDEVYLTAFAQALQLQPGESPFYANYGVAAIESVQTQEYPNTDVFFLQGVYAPNFVSLIVEPSVQLNSQGVASPVYNVRAITHQGALLTAVVPT